MVVNANLGTAQAAEIFLGLIGASAVQRISLLVVDPLHFETLMQVIPSAAFVGVHNRALSDASADESRGLAFGIENGRNRIAAALRHDNDHLALAALIFGEATVNTILLAIGGLHIPAEVTAIHFRRFAFPADHTALQFLCHRFAQLVQQNERTLVGDAKIAGQCQRRLALYLITEDRNGREITTKRELVAGGKGAAGEPEKLFWPPGA